MRARTLPTFVAALGLAVGFGCSEPTGPNAPAGSRARDTGATVSAAPGAAQPVTVMTRLVPNKCMDVLAGDRSPGAQVIIWPCHGAENQLWTLPPRGTTGEVRVYGDMCLDAYGGRGNDFDPIIIWPCHGGANQQWTLTEAGELRGINGKCVDVRYADPSDLTPLILWSCHGGANQLWELGGGTDAPAVLVGAGDIAGCSWQGDEATAALLDTLPGTVFTAGDNVYPNGTDAEFAQCYEPSWGRHKARTRPAPGNHDYETPGASGYFNYFGASAGDPATGYYSYDLGQWHVAVLNSNVDVSAASAQAGWLRADLAARPAACAIAYWHHPRFSSSARGNNTRYLALWQILYGAGADVVLVGHDHLYERFAPQTPAGAADPARGIRQFTVGTGGAGLSPFGAVQPNSEFRYSATHGVLRLELYATSYRWAFIGTDGAVRDAGTGSCH